jgi:hypothetical protein
LEPFGTGSEESVSTGLQPASAHRRVVRRHPLVCAADPGLGSRGLAVAY